MNVKDITGMIKQMGKLDLAQLGSNDKAQNSYIWNYMTLAMWKYVGLAYLVRTSDPLTVTGDGDVTFKRGNQPITDLYAIAYILDSSGRVFGKRSSFDATNNGWWRDSLNTPIHIRGNGVYTLRYQAFHPRITSEDQPLEWPATSYDLLMFETIGKIKESKNDIEGAREAYSVAEKMIPVLIKANIDARGTSGGIVPSHNEAQYYRR